MVSLSSVSGAGGSLYLEIRQIELHGNGANASYRISGMVGDGCDEALIKVDLSELAQVEIIPICSEDGTGGMLDERVGQSELKRLILQALAHIYFCVESASGRRASARVTGYADAGRLFHLERTVVKPHTMPKVAEYGPRWLAA